MPENSINTRERQACFGPPEPSDDDLMCRADDGATSGASTAAPASRGDAESKPKAVPSATSADYQSESLSLNLSLVSVSVSHTTDRLGQNYWGLGASVGVGVASVVGTSTSAGRMFRGSSDEEPSADDFRHYLCGNSMNVKGGAVVQAGVNRSSGGTAFEVSTETAVGISMGISHNWGSKCP
jgi:hypothetical protein